MDPKQLIELAERCEKAAEPDRELDAAVMFDLYAKPVGHHKADGGPTGYLWPEDDASWNFGLRFPGKDRAWFEKTSRGGSWHCNECGANTRKETLLIERDGALVLMNDLRIPPLTASLDSAMTLVNGHGVLITLSEIKGDGMPHCVIGNPETSALFEAVADTMPLALCAAALRARATQ